MNNLKFTYKNNSYFNLYLFNIKNIDSYKTKRCLPFFYNLFNLPAQPNMNLFLEMANFDTEFVARETMP